MARNGSGTYTAVVNSVNPAVATTTIDASDFNDMLDDVETALTESIARDGQTPTTAVVPFASGIKADTIVENSSNTGVTIDGTLVKDGVIYDTGGNESLTLTATGSAVNAFSIVNAATGVAPGIISQGEANIGMKFSNSESEEILILASTATSVNEVTITSQAAGTAPSIAATGSDTNIDLNFIPKGSGQVDVGTGGATQAEQETGTATDKIVTPGRQHFNPSAAKFWATFNGQTGAVVASYNVTSTARDSEGDYTVTIATDFSSAGYAVLATMEPASAQAGVVNVLNAGQAAGVIQLKAVNLSGTDQDADVVHVVGYGDQ